MAQLGSALDWGSRGRRFKSGYPESQISKGARCLFSARFFVVTVLTPIFRYKPAAIICLKPGVQAVGRGRVKLTRMTQSQRRRRTFTPQEYLELERKADFKSEYLDGEIYPMGEWQRDPKSGIVRAMAGASPAHNTICTNAVLSLGNQLRGKPCQTWSQNMRVKTPNTQLYTYPDVLVACPPHHWDDTLKDTLLNSVVLIEVLSPSTQSYDLQDKGTSFREIESLRHYLIIWQDEMLVRHFERQIAPQNGANSVWIEAEFTALHAAIELTAVDCTLTLAELYERLSFAAPTP